MTDISDVPFQDRVLLLAYCLRPSQDCPGKMTKRGLDCAGCNLDECAIHQLRTAALNAGYKGVCVAPGGRLAVRFLTQHQPKGVVAVACDKELQEGQEIVDQIAWQDVKPVVATVPLLQDGCVDTCVDLQTALDVLLNSKEDPSVTTNP